MVETEQGDYPPSFFDNELQNSSSATASELFYIANGRSLKALAILCEGLSDESDSPLVDDDRLPWSAAKKVTDFKPTANDLRAEVIRRAKQFEITPEPRPNAWTRTACKEWLKKNYQLHEDDIAFIKKTIADHVEFAQLVVKERALEH